jgi:RNA polymerase sigma-70 factor (ECF subfamily)
MRTAEDFETMINRSHQRDIAVARRFVGNDDDAADVVQESYLRAWRALPSFRREATLSTWMHAIIANTARTWRRKRNHHAALDDEALDLADPRTANDPAWHGDIAVDRARLDSALAELADGMRRVVVLKDIHGLSHQEIAAALGITEAAAKVRLHRARRQLRLLLTDDADRREEAPLSGAA